MRISALLAPALLTVGLAMPGPVQANFLDRLTGREIRCDVDDRDCIRALYIDEIVQAADEASSQDYAARDFARQTRGWTKPDQQAALYSFAADGLGDEFFSAYIDEIALIEAEASLDYAGIERAVTENDWPEALKWRNFIREAAAQVLTKPDQAEALWRLWQQEQAFFEENAPRVSGAIMSWGLNHKTDETLAYLASDQAMPEVAMRGVGAIASAAALQCDEGNLQAAETLTRTYRQFQATQTYDEGGDFLPLSYEAVIALSCAPEAEADAAFDAFVDDVDSKFARNGKTFETDWARGALEDIAVSYALRAHESGNDAKARDYLLRGASRDMIIAMQLKDGEPVDITAWDVLVGGEWPDHVDLAERHLSAELDMIEQQNEWKAYDPSLDIRFAYFADEYDPSFEICCTGQDMLERIMSTIEEASASRDVDAAARRLLELTKRLEAIPDRSFPSALSLRLGLAKLDRAQGCTHSPALLSAWLAQVSQLEYATNRAEALANFLDYMAVAPNAAPADGCYFSD